MVLFMLWEAKFARNPLIPIRIFETKTLVASFVVACLHAFVFISFDFFLPLYYQIVLGFRPLISGLTFFAFVIPLCLSTYLGGVFIGKTGNYIAVIFAGTSILTFGAGLLIDLGKELSWSRIICFEIIIGVGAGLLFQSPMISLQSHLRQEDIAAAMSAFTFLRNLFTSTSIVVGTVLIQNTLGSGSLTTEIDGGSAGDSKRNEYVVGLRNMRIFYTCVAAVTMLAACFIKPKVEKDNNLDDVEVQQVDGQGDGLQRKEEV